MLLGTAENSAEASVVVRTAGLVRIAVVGWIAVVVHMEGIPDVKVKRYIHSGRTGHAVTAAGTGILYPAAYALRNVGKGRSFG